MLCSISDIYEAMRSQRAYQQAFPDRAHPRVLKRNDGTQFDQHLVPAFVQLLGIYPPGNLVRCRTGEVAVVARCTRRIRTAARPRAVRRAARASICRTNAISGSRPQPGAAADSVVVAVDPAEFGIDPLNFLPTDRRAHDRSVAHHPVAALSVCRRNHLAGLRTAAIPLVPRPPVAELRLAQIAALVLRPRRRLPGIRGDARASRARPGHRAGARLRHRRRRHPVRDPRQALTLWRSPSPPHAVLDVAHRPASCPKASARAGTRSACAVFNVYVGAVTYWPIPDGDGAFPDHAVVVRTMPVTLARPELPGDPMPDRSPCSLACMATLPAPRLITVRRPRARGQDGPRLQQHSRP
jgi:hypothetical protein